MKGETVHVVYGDSYGLQLIYFITNFHIDNDSLSLPMKNRVIKYAFNIIKNYIALILLLANK